MTPLAATLGPTAYWYMTRATGFVSLVLLTAIVVLGTMGPLRVAAPRWPRFAIDSMHRDLSLLAVGLIIVHVITTVLDGFAPISLIDAIIPFHSGYRPLWLGLGAVAFDLIIALVVTSLVRRRLGYRTWRALHWFAYACWPIAVFHGLGTGTDSKQSWGLLVTFACVLTVAAAVVARVTRTDEVTDGARTGAVGAAVAVPVALAAFTLLGPLAPHWAERAGTPKQLLFTASRVPVTTASTRSRASATTTPASAAPTHLKLPFTARVAGSLKQQAASGGAVLDIELRLTGGISGAMRIRLAGQPIDGNGLSMVGSQVDLVAAGLPAALQGKVTSLEGTHLTAHVAGGPEKPLNLSADLQIDNGTGSVTGTLIGQAAR